MKIALLTDGVYPYVMGGIQKHSYYLAKSLVRHGIYIDLYHTGPAEADTYQLHGFTDSELTYIKPIYISFPSITRFPGHYLFKSYIYSRSIYQELTKREKVDLIYCQGLTGWYLIKQSGSMPIILANLHGLNMYQYSASIKAKLEDWMLRLATNSILKKSNYVVSLGGKLSHLLEVIGVNRSKIVEQPIGIGANWLIEKVNINFESQSNRRFVFVGRYDKVKGIDLLSNILTDLEVDNFEFYFIGPIPEEKQLKQNNIKYLGLIKDEQEIKTLLRSVDVLVCPSYSEGMPTVILEAMASGLAIIASDVGAVGTMVSSENGWLIPVADKIALREAIQEAINLNESILSKKKEKSWKLVKDHYTWDKVIALTLDKFNSIVNKQ
ncbi:glycosyltransferase family 4 protein [Pontibacter sp. H249]|uniref:glycosyltransferase family 4 protein n=1 Tax=Pontibacter sp. H249 TaxID=3133420 RepID=UPI0030BB2DA3